MVDDAAGLFRSRISVYVGCSKIESKLANAVNAVLPRFDFIVSCQRKEMSYEVAT
jgi:hypothetical protein